MSDLHTNGTANRAPTGAQDDVVTQVLAWWHDDRSRTHSVSCWQWHAECVIATLGAEVRHRQAEILRLRRRVERFNIALADLEHLSTERAVLHRIKEARRA
jgi:hypothetical protein